MNEDKGGVRRTLDRKPAVREAMGWGNSNLYQKIKDRLFVPPVKCGTRASAWPSDEVSAVQAAYVSGRSPDQIRKLVAELVAARKTADLKPLMKGGA